jgi:hypothetical protein
MRLPKEAMPARKNGLLHKGIAVIETSADRTAPVDPSARALGLTAARRAISLKSPCFR